MARGSLYFPGLFKHHSLFFRGGFQSELGGFEDLNRYHFRNVLFRPRGFSYPRDTEFLSLSANYALPIWYPDINIGPFLNIQRFKANAFFDYGQSEGKLYFYYFQPGQDTKVYFIDNSATYQSVGLELKADINVMRLLPQFEVGVRMSYVFANNFNNSGTVFEFILGNIPF
jgi:hypothetical protein